MRSSIIFYIAIVIWLFVATNLWYDIEKQKIANQNFVPDSYALEPVKIEGATVGLYRINKNTGVTHYYSPHGDSGGWVKIADTTLITISKQESEAKRELIDKIAQFVSEGTAEGGKDELGFYLRGDDKQKIYIDKLDTDTLKNVVSNFEKKKLVKPNE